MDTINITQILVAFAAIFASQGFWSWLTFKTQTKTDKKRWIEKRYDLLQSAVVTLLYDRLLTEYEKHINDPPDEQTLTARDFRNIDMVYREFEKIIEEGNETAKMMYESLKKRVK